MSSIPVEDLRFFLTMVSDLATKECPADVALCCVEELAPILHCERVSFFFVDGEFLELVLAKDVDNIRIPMGKGIAGDCAHSEKLISVPDAYLDDRFDQKFDKQSGFRTKAILAAPVKDGRNGKVVAIIQCLNKKCGGEFTDLDIIMMEAVVDTLGHNLHRTYALGMAAQVKRQKDAVLSLFKTLHTKPPVSSILMAIFKAAKDITHCERVTMYSIDWENKLIKLVSADMSQNITFPVGKGIAGEVAETGKNVIIKDVYKDDRFNPEFDKKSGFKTRNMLVIPISSVMDHGKTMGVLQMINKDEHIDEGGFTADDEETMMLVTEAVLPMIAYSRIFIFEDKSKSHEEHASDCLGGSKNRTFRKKPKKFGIDSMCVISE